MNQSNKLLGAAGILGAPFLFFETLFGQQSASQNTSLGGLCDLVYMLGWMCSIVGLLQLQAAGIKKWGMVLLYLQLSLLCVANVWNVWVIFKPGSSSPLFFILDFFWPLSNVCMLATGIAVAVTGRLQGWRRYSVLLAGLWLPIAIGSVVLFGRTSAALFIGGIYSTLAWSLVGLTIYTTEVDEVRPMKLAL